MNPIIPSKQQKPAQPLQQIKQSCNPEQSQHSQSLSNFNQSNQSNHLNNHNLNSPAFKLKQQSQKQIDYYQQFCKLYLANAVLQTHLKQLAIQKSQLLGKLHKLQKKAQQNNDGNSNSMTQRKKRIRRSAADIARHYKCTHQNCSKSYGSQGSLNQHIKLKHPDIFKTLNIPQHMLLKQFLDQSYSQSKQ